MSTLLRGKAGEAKAAEYFRAQGWDVVAASYRCRYGEIDLIVKKRNTIAFVEVKLRKNDGFAPAFAAVTDQKQERLRKTAAFWLAENGEDWECRFDVVEIYTDTGILNHIKNAFQ